MSIKPSNYKVNNQVVSNLTNFHNLVYIYEYINSVYRICLIFIQLDLFTFKISSQLNEFNIIKITAKNY